MNKDLIILGSTGSIGQNTLSIIQKYRNNYNIKLLSTNKNLNKIIQQAKRFKVKNVIINDLNKFKLAKKNIKN